MRQSTAVDRYAIFVDVGYVVASVAELLAGSAGRHLVTCDYGQLVRSLVADATSDSGVPHLRTYWYDASVSGQPEHDQLTVADVPGVRLRLGRLVRGGQKGVDSRLVRDLIVLARDRAMVAAYLLAGDEDICEGVAEAQDHGVRLTVLGVPGVNQSRLLIQQSDEHRVLPEEFWRSHFTLVEPVRERPAAAVTTTWTCACCASPSSASATCGSGPSSSRWSGARSGTSSGAARRRDRRRANPGLTLAVAGPLAPLVRGGDQDQRREGRRLDQAVHD
jgi:NYN domain